jgi:hypothetical protein
MASEQDQDRPHDGHGPDHATPFGHFTPEEMAALEAAVSLFDDLMRAARRPPGAAPARRPRRRRRPPKGGPA